MRWLRVRDKKFESPAEGSEKGAIAVLTAVMMVALLLMVAMVADTGIAYTEKAQLQNAADSAALAAAECKAQPTACTVSPASLVNQNSNDNASTLHALDFSTPGQVTATTSTLSNGTDYIALPFSGITHVSQGRVSATATAKWGGVWKASPTLPLTFGACELDPTKYPMDGTDRLLIVHGTFGGHGSGAEVKCASWNPAAGLNMPGGFGWLTTDASCKITLSVTTAWSDPGANVPNQCKSLFTASLIGQTVLVPIFGYADGTGANGNYQIIGWGLFVVKGFHFPSLTQSWTFGNSVQGLYGHFTKKLTFEEGLTYGGPTEYGATGVSLTK